MAQITNDELEKFRVNFSRIVDVDVSRRLLWRTILSIVIEFEQSLIVFIKRKVWWPFFAFRALYSVLSIALHGE